VYYARGTQQLVVGLEEYAKVFDREDKTCSF
jgi:hypothetical protein